jgi:hypothetical protein
LDRDPRIPILFFDAKFNSLNACRETHKQVDITQAQIDKTKALIDGLKELAMIADQKD